MPKHGVYVSEQSTSVSAPVSVETGIPFVIGLSPVHTADNPAAAGAPVLVTSFAEFEAKLGYSDDWATYPLCEFAYSHFKLFGKAPAIFVNLLDPATMKSAVAASDLDVSGKKVELTVKAIDDASLVVKAQGGNGNAYVKDTDYSVYYNEAHKLVVEVLPDGACYSASKLNIAYSEVTPASVTTSTVATGLESIELCMSKLGLIPDLIVAPGFSENTGVAAVMATKAAAINGMFRAKALIDISTASSGGADSYDEVVALKNSNNFTDPNELVCWPLFKLDDKVFHASTIVAGRIAATDGDFGAPYASPSNKDIPITSLVVIGGSEINLSLAQANILNAGGVITALNFMGGFKLWGNYTACYPTNTDVKDNLLCVSRMFDWVANTLIRTFWSKLDDPMNKRLVDSIVDTANIWMNGLTGSGFILGGRVEYNVAENPTTSLMAGIIKLHVYITPPSPAQEIDFVLEYDASYVEAAFA
jgi:phage tail sheath protein FI